jgi:regulator of replication initiation timing
VPAELPNQDFLKKVLTDRIKPAIIKTQREKEIKTMDNEKMIAEFYAKIKELYDLGRNIVNHYNDDEDRANVFNALDEIENMSMHCECCISELRKYMGYTK